MAQEETVVFPPGILKYIGLGLAALALVIYGTWSIYFYVLNAEIPFDLGLFSFTLPIFLFGVFLTLLFSSKEKKLKQEQKLEKGKERERRKRK